MKNFIVTFEWDYYHTINGKILNKETVAVIKAEDQSEAEKIAFKLFGWRFVTTYSEEEFDKNDSIRYFPRGKIAVN